MIKKSGSDVPGANFRFTQITGETRLTTGGGFSDSNQNTVRDYKEDT